MGRTTYTYRDGAGRRGRAYAAGILKLLGQGRRLTVQRTDRVPRRQRKPLDRLLAAARSQLGVVEVGGENRGPSVSKYQAATTVPGTGWPWCQAFVRWCMDQAGILRDGYRGAYVPDFERWARVVKLWRTGRPRAGWAIVFGGTGHVGIVEKVTTTLSGRVKVHTIEGNASDGVRRMTYDVDDPRIRGYVAIVNP